uniref:Endonuclease/exonuclease/phosphatase domain-containing protein n=1 Tax=viral metagenome TaxID=1070528 RepID=A0A6C0DGR9_9ZZZZ
MNESGVAAPISVPAASAVANSSNSHVIGTYNMSFMSDLNTAIGPGMAFASEGAFLARLRGLPDERRSYWINAMNLLKDFLVTESPSVVGLQEMNLTAEGANSGTDAINQMLVGTGYKQISQSVPANSAGVSIIYNPAKVGEVKHVQCIDNVNQPGRPLLMVVTKKDDKHYLSVSVHGAQNPGLRLDKAAFNTYMEEKNKLFLESSASTFLDSNGIDVSTLAGIFIMGDFNDRYDGIKDITIGGKVATYSGVAPKSCCYNWDSSCPDTDVQVDFGDGYKTCTEPAASEIKTATDGKLTLPGDRGATKNYKYAGDKVFGFNPKTPMAIYRPAKEGWNGISTESDHELVYATVGEAGASGGRRRKGRKTQKKNRKAKKSRKVKRHNH